MERSDIRNNYIHIKEENKNAITVKKKWGGTEIKKNLFSITATTSERSINTGVMVSDYDFLIINKIETAAGYNRFSVSLVDTSLISKNQFFDNLGDGHVWDIVNGQVRWYENGNATGTYRITGIKIV